MTRATPILNGLRAAVPATVSRNFVNITDYKKSVNLDGMLEKWYINLGASETQGNKLIEFSYADIFWNQIISKCTTEHFTVDTGHIYKRFFFFII